MSKTKVSILTLLSFSFLLTFSHAALAFPDQGNAPVILHATGEFYPADRDEDGQPDHLAYRIKLAVERPGEYWLSGELQTLVGDEWQTINYTAVPYQWGKGPQTGEINFYGGELRRRQVAGPCRIKVTAQMGGWRMPEPLIQETSVIPPEAWQESDLAVTDGTITRGSQAVRLARNWAQENQKELGDLREKTFAFDRWRMDFGGTTQEPPRRLWVDPQGDISAVDRRQ